MNCGDTGKGASRHNPALRDSAELFMSEMLRGRGYFQHGSTTERHHSLCCRIVLKTTLTAGGTPRQRRMERRPPADLLPFVARNHARQAKPDRALAPLSMLATLAPPAANAAWRGARSGRKGSRSGAFGRLCRTKAQASRPRIHAAFRPCGTRAAFAATFVAAHAGVKEHVTHRAINTVPLQSAIIFILDESCFFD